MTGRRAPMETLVLHPDLASGQIIYSRGSDHPQDNEVTAYRDFALSATLDKDRAAAWLAGTLTGPVMTIGVHTAVRGRPALSTYIEGLHW